MSNLRQAVGPAVGSPMAQNRNRCEAVSSVCLRELHLVFFLFFCPLKGTTLDYGWSSTRTETIQGKIRRRCGPCLFSKPLCNSQARRPSRCSCKDVCHDTTASLSALANTGRNLPPGPRHRAATSSAQGHVGGVGVPCSARAAARSPGRARVAPAASAAYLGRATLAGVGGRFLGLRVAAALATLRQRRALHFARGAPAEEEARLLGPPGRLLFRTPCAGPGGGRRKNEDVTLRGTTPERHAREIWSPANAGTRRRGKTV